MKTIYKYQLKLVDVQAIELPEGSEILDVQAQRDEVCLWARVDTSLPLCKRWICVVGTGNPCGTTGDYVGTFQLNGGDLVFHVFVDEE